MRFDKAGATTAKQLYYCTTLEKTLKSKKDRHSDGRGPTDDGRTK